MDHSKALAESIKLFRWQVAAKLVVFALHSSEVAEIGGMYTFLHQAPRIMSQIVTQRFRLYSEAWAGLERSLVLFSFTSCVFLPICWYSMSLCLPWQTF